MDLKSFIIPAIDIKEGKVVRLFKGEFDKVKEYFKNPEEVAKLFEDKGFKRIHVIDLDGAKEGTLKNIEKIKKIRKVFSGKIELGGGIRNFEIARNLFEEGIDFIIVGTLAVKNREEFLKIVNTFPERVILAIDSKGGKVAVSGWLKKSEYTWKDLIEMYDKERIKGYLYTIIERDGSLEGVDVEAYKEVRKHTEKELLASGGVSSLEDVKKLYGIADGVVIGKAIYEGTLKI